MPGEDDLRALAKIMAFIRAVSILRELCTYTGFATVFSGTFLDIGNYQQNPRQFPANGRIVRTFDLLQRICHSIIGSKLLGNQRRKK